MSATPQNVLYRVTDEGVRIYPIFVDWVNVRHHLLALAIERVGDAWWDHYNERMKVVDMLSAGYLEA